MGAIGLLITLQIAAAQAADIAQPTTPFVVSVGTDGVQRATIMLDSYSYTPKHLIVEAGKPVELTLTSVTTITPHNFIIKELSVEQDLSAGKTVTITFTPTQTGTFPIYCDKRLWPLPSHRDKGMEGTFEVR
jgi:heme/copper-type cytochrome/quinol oxidase subunit 2